MVEVCECGDTRYVVVRRGSGVGVGLAASQSVSSIYLSTVAAKVTPTRGNLRYRTRFSVFSP